MKVNIYNQEGKEAGQTLLPKEIFDVRMNKDLLHQVVVSQMANRRQVIAHVKDRSEVRGGGRKPWRQKGTGRARHGSTRSPIWRGGGVTFGPSKDRVFKKKINKKVRRKALFMVLTQKAKDGELIILDRLEIEKPKTKIIYKVLENLKVLPKTCLIALPAKKDKIILASRNIPKIQTLEVRNLNPLDVLNFKYLVMPKESIKVIKETFAGSN